MRNYIKFSAIAVLFISLGFFTVGGCGGGGESASNTRGFVCPRCFTPLNDGLCVCSCNDNSDGTSRSCHACSFLGVVFDSFCEDSNSPCPTSPCPPNEVNTMAHNEQISERIIVTPLDTGCKISGVVSADYQCEEIAYVRQCEFIERVASDTDTMQAECSLYNCQDCSLNPPFTVKETVESQ